MAISRTEIKLGVFPPKCHSGKTFAHNTQKRPEVAAPRLRNFDAFPAALRITRHLRIAANAIHRLPRSVCGLMALVNPIAMRAKTHRADFAVSAATTCSAALPHIPPLRDNPVATIAVEQPQAMPASIFMREVHSDEASESQSRHVDTFLAHHHGNVTRVPSASCDLGCAGSALVVPNH